ncbi:ankyrin repeat protein [Metarhizium robertsii]|uniref:Ankyrin repeat protein n=1 Tax=Metarhizium robertsii TaxID=568076 RepID=A0A0A1URB2_9HYPO|nr:ankyrin repeat protein [Metarhizium robertsii]
MVRDGPSATESTPVASSSDTKSPPRTLGLVQVYPDPEHITATDQKVDSIIAMHGLDAKSPDTWIAWKEDGNPASGDVHWLRDDDMLPRSMPNSRILTYDWNANYAADASSDKFLGHADALLDRIYVDREDTGRLEHPIIFVASCFGGLLLAQALIRSADQFHPRGKNYRQILDCTIGVVFLGTPFRGSWEFGYTTADVRVSAAIATETEFTRELIEYLKQGTPELPGPLDQLVQRFSEMIHHRDFNFDKVCFYETRRTDFSAKIKKMTLPESYTKNLDTKGRGIVVTKDSACLQGVEGVALDVRHNMLHKFNSPKNDGYRRLVSRLKGFSERPPKVRLSKEEQKCHQLFRLTSGSHDATYEWYKGRVEEKVEDTCLWFLNHEHFQVWLKQQSGPLLVTADPGCGKSVLAKYLIDHVLLRSAPSTAICYFFFKDQDQNTVRQALCALLHQLFDHKPSLIKHAMSQYSKDGQGLINSTESLWKVLRNAIEDPQTGPVIIVLDALDECSEAEFPVLMRNVERHFRNDKSGPRKLKYLLTCRPYEQIVSKFRGLLKAFPNIHIPGEEESETISQEVNRVITHRANQLSTKKGLSDQIKCHLEAKLREKTHRTYLWVYLMFDYLEKEDFKKTKKGVDESTIATLPGSVNQAYEQILNKSKDHPMVRKVLSIILVASRPLTISEMNVAVNVDDNSHSIRDLDLENEDDFKLRLRSLCGLFVSIHHGKIYFLHQTAREFLLADLASPTTVPSGLHWHHSITTRHAHAVLAGLCVRYLNFFNSDVTPPTDAITKADPSDDTHAFLDYSAKSWGAHFREAEIIGDASIVPFALRICDPGSKSYSTWFSIYWETTHMENTEFTDLIVASYFGHNATTKLLLDKGAEVNLKDSKYDRTPLSWAAINGREAIVKLLLDKGAEVDSKDSKYGQTPLSWAAENGYEAIIKLLLDKGAEVDSKDSKFNRTPLSWAAMNGREAIVKLLLYKGAEVDSKDSKYNRTPLLWATINGREAIVKLLLDKGAEVNSKDSEYGWTPLWWAARNSHEAVVKLLLDKGAEVNLKDSKYGRTPLSWAAQNSHEAIVKLLLDKGAEFDSKDSTFDQTPLWYAVRNNHKAIVKLLLDKGVEVNSKDSEYGWTPLWWAARNNYEAIIKLLLDKGAEVNMKDSKYNRTPLLWAVINDCEAIVKLLLDKGAEVNWRDSEYGWTPLWWAARNGHEAIIKLLLDHGA